jgi:DNA-binding SARP family transcriptional activator
VEAAALRGLRLGAEDLSALVQGMVAHYGPAAESEEVDDPAGEVASGAVGTPDGEIAAPDAVADEYDYHADLARLTVEDEATAGEGGMGDHVGSVGGGQAAALTPAAVESAADDSPARPATGTDGADSWWEQRDETSEPIAVPRAASAAPCSSRHRAGDATAMEAVTSAETGVGDCDALNDSECSPASRGAGSSTNPKVLDISCFGPQLRVHYDGRRITLSSPKATELLAFLAVQPPGPIDREMVLHQVWPDRRVSDDDDGDGWGDDAAKGKRLRTTIWRLKRDLTQEGVDLPASLVRIERDGTIVFDTTIARSDVQRFFALCDRATERRNPPPLAAEGGVVAACREAYDLMTSHSPGERRLLGATGYDWLDEPWRGVKIEDRLRARLRHASERTIERCLAEGWYEAALGLLQPLFEEDYTDEAVARQLLTVYGHLGDRASVLYVDRMLRQALRRTLYEGLTARERAALTEEACAPARETRLLVARLLAELSDEKNTSPGGAPHGNGHIPSGITGHAVD